MCKRIVFTFAFILAHSGALIEGFAGKDDSPPSVHFEEVAEKAGVNFRHISGDPKKDYIVESKGGGVTVLDYNNDGWLDLYLVSGTTFERYNKLIAPGDDVPRNALYRGNGDGTFTDVTKESGTGDPGWGMGASSADFDNDGDADLYLANYGNDVLFRNNGDGTFSDFTNQAGIAVPNWSTGSAWGDYDRDGDLDLYVARYIEFDLEKIPTRGANSACQYRGIAVQCGPRGLPPLPDRLYRNEGNGTFLDVTEKALGSDLPKFYSFTPIWTDFEGDGWPDLFVSSDSAPNLYYHNLGDGTFEEAGAISGCAYSRDALEQSGMGADVADIDHDGRLDLFVANFSEDYNTLYRNLGESFFEDITVKAKLMIVSWQMVSFALKFFDFDLDGWKDAFIVNGGVYPGIDDWNLDSEYRQHPQILRNQHDSTFKDVTAELGSDLLQKRVGRGAAFGDLDNDGDIDVLINNLDDRPSLLMCNSPTGNNWITFEVEGTRSNRDGIGAVIRLRSGNLEQMQEIYQAGGFLSGNDLRSHFGLGIN
ncbi:MAG: CRTAC1 family protein, partial [bacterium]